MTGLAVLILYVALFVAAYFLVRLVRRVKHVTAKGLNSRKTVTFGDESAVRADRAASIISVVVIFLIWGAFTNSAWVPIHVPGPFVGKTAFTYTAKAPDGSTATATVHITVDKPGTQIPFKSGKPDHTAAVARDDRAEVAAWRSVLIRISENDAEKATITAIDGKPVSPGDTLSVADGKVTLTQHGSVNFEPDRGLLMEPIWMPSPEAVVHRFLDIAANGYQNYTLWQHLGWSLLRVLTGFFFGSLVGIPLGYAMGLSGWVRGWFDPIVEFMRPVPPLALIPLIIIWFGIWETGKMVLLFLAALWIMTIAARAGVSGVNLTKVHAAYSLGANRRQILWHVIMPNSLPEIFTGARVAMGVCWGTVVAAELVAAQKGAGMMIIAASKFQLTDIVLMGIILIGIIGYSIDVLMRVAERTLVPWKGRS